jgi:hypothetical protein
MKNPYNQPPTTLGKLLHLVYGIDNRPYDSVEMLWAKVARSLGIRVSSEDELESVLARIVNAGGAPPAPPAPEQPFESSTPDIFNLVGLYGLVNVNDLAGVSDLTINATTNREGYQFDNCLDIVSMSFPNLVSLTGGAPLGITRCPSLTTLLVPKLVSIETFMDIEETGLTAINFASLQSLPLNGTFIFGNPSLVDLSLPLLEYVNGGRYNFDENALSAASVNAILARAVSFPGYVSGKIDIDGGTNSPPTGQGIADKATLIGRGVTVLTN